MFDTETLVNMGFFNQAIPIWQVFFYIVSLLPFLLLQRVKICLLITYLFAYYLGFMVQWGDYIKANGSMSPFILYALSGLLVAALFVATFFTEDTRGFRIGISRYSEKEQEARSIN